MPSVNELKKILAGHFFIHMSRITVMAQMILALIKVRTVSLTEVAAGFAGTKKTSSYERRIRRFLKEIPLSSDSYARFIGTFFPLGKWLLVIDRTVWEFGNTTINILVLGITYKGVAIPLMWTFLFKKNEPESGKKGNSDTKERIDLMNRFIGLFGTDRIEGMTADREFVGNDWFSWLNGMNIRIFIRVKENQYVTNSRGIPTRFSDLFRELKVGQSRILEGKRKTEGTGVYVNVLRLKNGELLIVVTFHDCDDSLEVYARRWQIETFFAAMKTRGFRFESTHLTDFERIDKLLGLAAIAFVLCYLVGDQLDSKKSIPIKNHGCRAKSIFRHGFDHIRRILLNLNEFPNKFMQIIRIFLTKTFANLTYSKERYVFVR